MLQPSRHQGRPETCPEALLPVASVTMGRMEILRAYRAVLDPNRDQLQLLQRHAGASRTAFNWATQEKRAVHQRYNRDLAELTYTTHAHLPPDAALTAARATLRGRPEYRIPTRNTLSTKFTRERGDYEFNAPGVAPWWRGINRYAFVSGLANADAAWDNWLASYAGRRTGRRVGYPRFKKKGRAADSFALFHDVKKPSIRVDDPRHLRIPNIGVVHLVSNLRRLWRRLRRGTAIVQSIRISRTGHRWYASVLVKEQMPDPITSRAQRRAGAVGVDLGVRHLAALSTGQLVDNPRAGAKAAKKLARAQRHLARCRKGSAGQTAARQRVARLQAHLAEQRHQTLHRLTKTLATSFATVAIEDLHVAGMTRSARGTLNQPGTHVRQKAGLNREILDVAFGEFRRQLTYKSIWYGSRLAVIDRWAPTSKTCSQCGALHPALTLADRTFNCPACGASTHRDINAARNIAALATCVVVDGKTHTADDDTTRSPAARPHPQEMGPPEAQIGTPAERPAADRLQVALTREDPPPRWATQMQAIALVPSHPA